MIETPAVGEQFGSYLARSNTNMGWTIAKRRLRCEFAGFRNCCIRGNLHLKSTEPDEAIALNAGCAEVLIL